MLMVARLKNKDFSFWCLAVLGSIAGLALLFPVQFLLIAPPCLFSAVLHWDSCWGCGMTRAGIALLRGDWQAAWQLNPRSLIVYPLLLVLYLQACWAYYRQSKGLGNT